MKLKTTEQFVEESIKIHGYKYDYTKSKYVNKQTKVKIICKIHGEFEQTPKNHLLGHKCPKCQPNYKQTQEQFIEKSKIIHHDKYDYSLVNYINSETKIKIICKICGNIFEQIPNCHTSQKQGCPYCANNIKLNIEIFIERSKQIFGDDKYDYSFSNYINRRTKVKIICKDCGELFEQTPDCHFSGRIGCKNCYKLNTLKTTKQFINEANIVHNYKYDYSLVDYKECNLKVKIICRIHGEFEQVAKSHLKHGCRKCGDMENRLKQLEKIEKNKLDGYQLTPSFNPIACELFNKMMKENNCYIQHAMNGGEYYINKLGYWLDGYDIENNIAYEYDEKHHFKNGELKEKDIIRQKEIENYLNCQFIRIKDEIKTRSK